MKGKPKGGRIRHQRSRGGRKSKGNGAGGGQAKRVQNWVKGRCRRAGREGTVNGGEWNNDVNRLEVGLRQKSHKDGILKLGTHGRARGTPKDDDKPGEVDTGEWASA